MKVYQNTTFSMGTRFNLLLPGTEAPEGDFMFSSCIKELNRLENMLSCFMATSDIGFINAHAFQHPVEVSNELFEILSDCFNYFELTLGTFDISLGKTIDHWNQKQNVEDLDKLIQGSGADNIILNFKNKTVRFATPYIKINLGGFGKGYALSKVQGILKELGITSAFISFGESSVSGLGKHPYGDYWPVGVQDFYQKDICLATLQLVNQSISTSGNMDQKNHIIHPKTGTPIVQNKMITVKSSSPVVAEVLSTALMVAEDNELARILLGFQGAEVLKVKYAHKKAEIVKFNS